MADNRHPRTPSVKPASVFWLHILHVFIQLYHAVNKRECQVLFFLTISGSIGSSLNVGCCTSQRCKATITIARGNISMGITSKPAQLANQPNPVGTIAAPKLAVLVAKPTAAGTRAS